MNKDNDKKILKQQCDYIKLLYIMVLFVVT